MRVHQQISGRCKKTRTRSVLSSLMVFLYQLHIRKCVSNECGSSLAHTEELQVLTCVIILKLDNLNPSILGAILPGD